MSVRNISKEVSDYYLSQGFTLEEISELSDDMLIGGYQFYQQIKRNTKMKMVDIVIDENGDYGERIYESQLGPIVQEVKKWLIKEK